MNIKFSFDETNVQVGFENQFVIKDMTEDTLVKILMLKGEKGDTVSGQWGTIIGNLTDQTDLKNALDSKASASDLNTTNSNVATNTGNIATNTGNIATNTAAIEENSEDIADLQTQVGTNTSDIADLTTQVGTNTGNIATNTSNIATNTGNIATNTSNIATNTSNIGSLSNLTTTDKTSLVNAVNEVNDPTKWVSVGSTAPTGGEKVWFAKSKNLFDINATPKRIEQCSISVSDNILNVTNNGSYCRTEWLIPTKSSNYIFSCNYSNPNNCSILVRIYKSDNSTIISQTTATTSASGSIALNFSTTEASVYIRIYSNSLSSANTGSVAFSNIQVEEGSTATTYEPYVETGINVDNELWYSKPKVLWTNSAPTSQFAGQTITINDDISNYKYYEILFFHGTDSGSWCMSTGKIPSNFKTRFTTPRHYLGYREVTITNTSAVFGNYIQYPTYGSSSGSVSNNAAAIPYQILGYK